MEEMETIEVTIPTEETEDVTAEKSEIPEDA
jgi:hypothetical protein